MRIIEDDLTHDAVIALLDEHFEGMHEVSPPGSCHVMDHATLRDEGVTVWTAWEGEELLGCGALKEIDADHGEVKSMRTAEAHLRKGVGGVILDHVIAVARRRGYKRLSLETGATDDFAASRALYSRFGFRECEPFADYREDPFSFFMTLELESG
jgi:putative acetyltransferase